MSPNPASKRVTTAIMIALAIWGIYLAIGSTGYFTEESLFDIRKSFIVAISSTSFLALWVFVLNAVDRRKQQLAFESVKAAPDRVEPSPVSSRSWSRAGLVTLGIGLLGLLLWVIAIAAWTLLGGDSKRFVLMMTTILGWLAAISMVGSATAGMIALSNPRKLKGKWLGVLGILFCVGSMIGFFIRMSP